MIVRFGGVDSYYSHGYLIPFIVAFLIWRKRERLKNMSPTGSKWGLAIIILALLLHLTGTVLYVFSLSGFSIYLLIIGATLFLFGKEIAKELAFPLGYIILMFPLPLAVMTAISFPLKLVAVKLGSSIVRMLGVPILREGFNISVPGGNLVVGNPCSGLRSILSFFVVGMLLAYLIPASFPRKAILILSIIPVAILSNIIRVPLLILIAYHWGQPAASPESPLHTLTGVLAFLLGIGLLLAISKILQWKS